MCLHKRPYKRLYKRPESVIVVVYTISAEWLVMRRTSPADFWQSVTGTLEFDELPAVGAQRELFEETGIRQPVHDHQQSIVFRIKPPWSARYEPGVTENTEHRFSICLSQRCEVRLNSLEHSNFQWLPTGEALQRIGSASNREFIQHIDRNMQGQWQL